MCSDFQLTMKQALAEVEQYKQVFTSVFMLDEGSVSSGESAQIRREMQTDHRFTDKLIDTVIEVCRAALAGKAVLSKLVFSDTEIYQITARYHRGRQTIYNRYGKVHRPERQPCA